MIVEHNVATMVVLSSEGQFWNYWPADNVTLDVGYMKVNTLVHRYCLLGINLITELFLIIVVFKSCHKTDQGQGEVVSELF